jgi:hypothetical protein
MKKGCIHKTKNKKSFFNRHKQLQGYRWQGQFLGHLTHTKRLIFPMFGLCRGLQYNLTFIVSCQINAAALDARESIWHIIICVYSLL